MPDSFTRRIRHFWQRRTRGFDDVELWNLNTYLTRHITPRIQAFATMPHICYSGESAEEWQASLDEMAWAFQFMIVHEYNYGGTSEEWERARAGMHLFAEWYGALWD